MVLLSIPLNIFVFCGNIQYGVNYLHTTICVVIELLIHFNIRSMGIATSDYEYDTYVLID